MLDLIGPSFINGDFNPNNVLTILYRTKPVYSFLIFILIFGGSMIGLNLWYYKLTTETTD